MIVGYPCAVRLVIEPASDHLLRRPTRHSATEGNDVHLDFSDGWSKSSFSGESGNCVEWKRVGNGVFLRDSKNIDGPMLAFSAAEMNAFIEHGGEHPGCRCRRPLR